MLTILRKIRFRLINQATSDTVKRSMLESSSARKYLFYGIGEIALVVIGILIALQINNWNEEKKKVQTIKVYLQSLSDDLKDDIEVFKELEILASFRYYSTQYLLKMANEPLYDPTGDEHVVSAWEGNYIWDGLIPDGYNTEFIKLAFLWTHRVESSFVNTSTIEELKSTGEYSYLNNEKLKDAINSYYSDWSFRLGSESKAILRDRVEYWQNALMDVGIINSNPYIKGDPIDLLKNNPAITGRLRALAVGASWHMMSAKILYERAEDLRNLIGSEIQKM